MLIRFFTLLLCFAALRTTAQNVTIINNYSGGDESLLPENYVLKDVTEHTYIINEFEPSNTGTRSLLDQMISYGLRSLVDNQYHVFDNRVESLISGEGFNEEASAIVRNAIWIHDLPFSESFPGFSNEVTKLAEKLRALDGFVVRFGEDDRTPPGNREVGLYVFQRMVFELKRTAEKEASDFLNVHLPKTEERGYDNQEPVLLVPKDFSLDPSQHVHSDLADLVPEERFILSPEDRKRGHRNRNENDEEPGFSEQIVELLEQNNRILANYSDRFADMQAQINELREDKNDDIRNEMAEMREMIRALASGDVPPPSDGTTTAAGTVSVTFEKNEHELSFAQKAKLNRVEIEMTKNPGYRALVTGYADKSGDPDFNAWISQKRALAVRNHLVNIGIDRGRLTVSYLGDAESESANPKDRRVEVTFLSGR